MSQQQFCTFFLDGLYFGIEVQKVQEVFRSQGLTRVPLASSVIRGLINLRGQIVTAIDLRQRLELAPRPKDSVPMSIVVRMNDGAVSFLVDEIGDVIEVSEEVFERPPETMQGIAQDLILGAFKLKERLLLILNTEKAAQITTPKEFSH